MANCQVLNFLEVLIFINLLDDFFGVHFKSISFLILKIQIGETFFVSNYQMVMRKD